jgi:hypothetical protein
MLQLTSAFRPVLMVKEPVAVAPSLKVTPLSMYMVLADAQIEAPNSTARRTSLRIIEGSPMTVLKN